MSNPQAEGLPERHQPETLRLRTLTPALTVSDLEASLAWYCDTVGFIVVQKWEEDGKIAGAVVEAGRIRLFLVQNDKEPSAPVTQTMQFYCSSGQDIDNLAAAIQSRGGVLDKPPANQPWGARSFDLLDPDGVLLTISSVEDEGAS
jgi:uncharacterized glyoxalase superfamily protein PhnB